MKLCNKSFLTKLGVNLARQLDGLALVDGGLDGLGDKVWDGVDHALVLGQIIVVRAVVCVVVVIVVIVVDRWQT